jgi:hypothetical protein
MEASVTSGSHPPEVEARQQLVTGLLRWLISLESDQSWTQRVLTVLPQPSGQVRYSLREVSDAAERSESDVLPDGVGEAVRTLQHYMFSPAGGTWVSAELSVTSAGQGDARFNFDEEPRLPSPDEAETGLTPEEIAAHLQTFPRPESAVPAWMRRAD